MQTLEDKKKWAGLTLSLGKEFGDGSPLDLQGILFLIGVQELGQGPGTFNKKQKEEIFHIAVCRLLEDRGHYIFEGRDRDGWPHWKKGESLPFLSPEQQEELLKQCIIEYFEDQHY